MVGDGGSCLRRSAVYGAGFRPIELVVGGLVAVIALCYLIEIFVAPVDWRSAMFGLVAPRLPDGEALMLAVGIIGATVMPHAVYLHSGLTQARFRRATKTKGGGSSGSPIMKWSQRSPSPGSSTSQWC